MTKFKTITIKIDISTLSSTEILDVTTTKLVRALIKTVDKRIKRENSYFGEIEPTNLDNITVTTFPNK